MNLKKNHNNWNELKVKLKDKYPELTDKDLHYKAGNEEGMLRMIEYKLMKTKEEMRNIITDIGFSPIEQ